MENGGDNEHRPWMFDDNGTTDTTDNYRMFVNAHLELGMVDAQSTCWFLLYDCPCCCFRSLFVRNWHGSL
jgi:hypothetical protein